MVGTMTDAPRRAALDSPDEGSGSAIRLPRRIAADASGQAAADEAPVVDSAHPAHPAHPEHAPEAAHALDADHPHRRRRLHRAWALALGGLAVPLTAAGLLSSNWGAVTGRPDLTATASAASHSTAAAQPAANATAEPTAVQTIYAPGARKVPQTGGVKFVPSATGPLSGKVIVIDPGHTGKYSNDINMENVYMYNAGWRPCAQGGSISVNKVRENTLAWKVAQVVIPQLLARGATVVETRIDDNSYGPCNNERAEIANREKANLLLSIHFDGVDNQSLHGFHVITSDVMLGGTKIEKASQAAAEIAATHLKQETALTPSNYAFSDEGPIVVHRELGALNGVAAAPAILVECANIRQADDAAYVESDAGQQTLGTALANAATEIVSGAGASASPTVATPPPQATSTPSAPVSADAHVGTGEADAQPGPSAGPSPVPGSPTP